MKKYSILIIISFLNTLNVLAQCNSTNDVSGAVGQNGLYGEYFAGYFNDVTTFFPATISTTTKLESTLNYTTNSWGIPMPPAGGTAGDQNSYSARYRGSINILTAGNYTFYLTSDDASFLFIDNDALTYPLSNATALVNNGGLHGAITASATIFLTAGYHNIQLLFGENAGGNTLLFEYSGPSIVRTIVPNSILCTGIQVPIPPTPLPSTCICKDIQGNNPTSGLIGQYYAGYFNDVQSFFTTNTPGLTKTENTINFNADNWGPIVPPASGTIADPNTFSTRWTGGINITTAGTYTFYLTSDDASYLWINNNAITTTPTTASATINNGGAHAATTISASIALPAGLNFIKIHFGENNGFNRAVFEYENTSIGIPKQVVPNSILCSSFPPQEPTVSPTSITYCQNAIASPLSATESNLLWYTVPTGGIGSASSPTPSTSTPGTTSYYVSQTVGSCEGLRSKIDIIVTPFSITTQPLSIARCPGVSASFTVVSTGTGLTYQWRKGGIPIPLATTATYTIASPLAADAGSYDVIVSSTCVPAITSNAAVLTIDTAPAITTSPGDQTVCIGTPASFSVAATGTGLTYQWRKGSTAILLATSDTYSIATTATLDAGTYDVIVSGTCPSAITTSSANLTITTLPTATSITYPSASVCTNGGLQNVTLVGTTGGAYSSTAGLTLNATTGDIDPSTSTAGDYVVTYTIAAAGGCTAVTTTANVTITPDAAIALSSATGTDVQVLCESFPITDISYTVTDATGVSALGLPAGLTTTFLAGVYTITGTPSVTGIFNYSVTATGGCGSPMLTGTITINPTLVASVTIISDDADNIICPGATVTFTATPVNEGLTPSYQWIVNGSPVGTDSPIYTDNTLVDGNIVRVALTTSEACAASTTVSSAAIVLSEPFLLLLSAPGTDAQNLCINTPITDIVYDITNGVTVSSTGLPLGVTGTLAGTTYTISGTPSVAGSFSYTVSVNGCTTPTEVGTLTIGNVPATPSPISGTATLCENVVGVAYSVVNDPLVSTYNWAYSGTGHTINGTSNAITIDFGMGATAGTLSVTSTNACGNSIAASLPILINSLPTLLITDPTAVCAPSTIDITAPSITAGSTAGLSYSYWTDAAGILPLGTPNTLNSSGTFFIQGTDLATTCSILKPVVVAVNPLPIVVITNPAGICAPATADITAPAVVAGSDVGLSYTYWQDALATVPEPNANALSVAGTYYIKGTSAAGCSTIQPVSVAANGALPLVLTKTDECGISTFTGSISFMCASSTFNYDFSVGVTYTGSVPPTAGTTSVGLNTLNGMTANTYTLRLHDPVSGCFADQTVIVNSNALPTVFTVLGGGNLCLSDTAHAIIGVSASEGSIEYKYIHTPLVGPNDTSSAIVGASEDIYFAPQNIAGTYTVYGYNVLDPLCKADMNGSALIIVTPKPTIDSIKTSCVAGAGSGTVNVYAVITSGNLAYSLDGITYQNSSTFTSVANGTYSVFVRERTTFCVDTAVAAVFFDCNLGPAAATLFNCNSPLGTTQAGTVISNVVDPDGNVLKFTPQVASVTVKGGTFNIDSLGNYTYTPLPLFMGVDTITYTVCDSVAAPICVLGRIVIKTARGGIYASVDTASVKINEVLSSSISILANDSADDGEKIYFTSVTNAATLSGGSISITSQGDYTYTPAQGFLGNDSIAYTIRDTCGNSAKAFIRIRVYEIVKKTIFIPEGFSPNGDGAHDFFVLGNIEGYKLRLQVFNRWGSLVYENNDYNDTNWWNGTSNSGVTVGDLLPDGTYFYALETDTGEKYAAYLTLKR